MSYPIVKFCDEATDKAWSDVDVNAFDKNILLFYQKNYNTLLFHLMSIYCWEYGLFSFYPKERKELMEARGQLKYGFARGVQETLIYFDSVKLYEDHKAGKTIELPNSVYPARDSFLEFENYEKFVRPKMIRCLEEIREFIELIS